MRKGNYEETIVTWFAQARSGKVPVDGKMLKEEALLIAKRLGDQDFKASDGWLDRHEIKFKSLSGERESQRCS